MPENILTIEEYFNKGIFIIPNYQRGFKWGVPDKEGNCAISVLMDNLIEAYENNLNEYFIQGVTVYEENGNIYLIDGQQRTTTFFLLLKYLEHKPLPEIEYTIRKESDYALKKSTIENGELKFIPEGDIDYDLQDIYYFKKAIKTINNKLRVNNESFKEFILHSVKLFYIKIAKEKATKVFSMMNGQRAIMKTDELIKAALLSKASRQNGKTNLKEFKENDLNDILQLLKNRVGEEWEINSLRSKYAREWDKWLYWWNKNEVKAFFGSGNNPLGLLLEYYFELHKLKNSKDKSYTYKNFSELFFKDVKESKNHFKRIRDLQKTFEDWYNNYESYNNLGLILKTTINKKEALLYFLGTSDKKVSLMEYAKWTLIGATHRQITKPNDLNEDELTKESIAEKVLIQLSQSYVYWDEHNEEFDDGRKEMAFRQFLRINVELDNQLNRKFDFSIWNNRSLEHIYPKSKKSEINWSNSTSVHCIGNLVLLYGRDNSSFGALDFDAKKSKLFNCFYKEAAEQKEKERKNILMSNSLLHTVSVFSNKSWQLIEIEKNKQDFIERFEKCYGIKLK